MLPTLGPRIVESAGEQADSAFEAALAESLEATRRQAALVQLISTRVQASLEEAGIRSAPLKGPQLGEALYGEPGRRPSSDIDLLVAGAELQRAVSVVRELGYAPPGDHVGPNGLPLLHFALVHERSELPPVELHWCIHWYESAFARDRLLPPAGDAEAGIRPRRTNWWSSSSTTPATGWSACAIRPTSVCGGSLGQRLGAGDLERSLRPYPALRGRRPRRRQGGRRSCCRPARRGAGRRRDPPGARARAAVRLTNPLPHSGEAQVFADMGLIDGLLTPYGGWRDFFLRQVAPPATRRGSPPRTPPSPSRGSVTPAGCWGATR